MRMINLTGKKFGRWTVIRKSEIQTTANIQWSCVCECGKVGSVQSNQLIMRRSRSCGCLRREVTASRSKTHGNRLGRRSTPEYTSWQGMKDRCHNPKQKRFKDYGARGITVCDRWRNDFAAFLEDMGPKPSPDLSLDRINNDGNYEPGNCRWATPKEQANNARARKPTALKDAIKAKQQPAAGR